MLFRQPFQSDFKSYTLTQELYRVNEIVAEYEYDPANLIAILQETQTAYSYLSEDSQTLIAEKLEDGYFQSIMYLSEP